MKLNDNKNYKLKIIKKRVFVLKFKYSNIEARLDDLFKTNSCCQAARTGRCDLSRSTVGYRSAVSYRMLLVDMTLCVP